MKKLVVVPFVVVVVAVFLGFAPNVLAAEGMKCKHSQALKEGYAGFDQAVEQKAAKKVGTKGAY